jgi:hypothetical protein
MEAREAKLTTVLTETFVLFVPAWQRRYAWDQPQWTKMWAALERAWHRQGKEYFLGAIVAQEAGTLGPVLERRRIIDGQQRLVTLSLFVAALQQRAAHLGLTELEDQLKRLLFVDDDKLRLSPWGKDERPYRACLTGEDYDGESRIPIAHDFFVGKLRGYNKRQLSGLWEAVRARLYLAYVLLSKDDDAHEIFQALNDTGKQLEQTDLIRNHLFLAAGSAGDDLFRKYWEPMENRLRTQDRLESFLLAETATDPSHKRLTITRKDLYTPYQREFDKRRGSGLAAFVKDRAHGSKLYSAIQTPEALLPFGNNADKIIPQLKRLNQWKAEPVAPIILDVLRRWDKQELNHHDVVRCFGYIESFLVRRFLAGVSGHTLSRIFYDLILDFPPGPSSYPTKLKKALSIPGHAWRDDVTVTDSLTTSLDFYTAGRGPQRVFVLQTLDAHVLTKDGLKREHVGRDWQRDLTIEHIMPQTLTPNWRRKIKAALPAGSRSAADIEAEHERLIHRLGNLTLMRAKTQPKLRNKSLKEKLKIIREDLQIRLNDDLAENYEDWGPREIQARGADLARLACAIWTPPG